ncbi:MAG: tetratricopeptide repeat protein [Polyangia bacterium]
MAACILVVAAAALSPAGALADEFEEFIKAKNAYEAGEYETAVERFEALLDGDPRNPALVNEAYKLMGVSYLFVGREEEAEKSFLKLLTRSPEYELDPMLFPIEVVDFFTEVKLKNDKRLAALAQARAAEKEAERRAEEKRRLAELEKLKRNVYLEKDREQRSLLVAVMPLGAGQFQNGEPVKGGLFLGGELLLGAAAVTTYVLHEGLRRRSDEPFESTSDRREYERLERGYRISNQVSLGALAVLAVAGVVDSLYFFEKETVSWQQIDKREVPDRLRPENARAILAPFASGTAIGLSASGAF